MLGQAAEGAGVLLEDDDEPFDELLDEDSDEPPDELDDESELPELEEELDSDELVLSAGLVLVDEPFFDSLERLSVR
nr:hypothetical protein [Phytoactinopolyspora alkaliphila]